LCRTVYVIDHFRRAIADNPLQISADHLRRAEEATVAMPITQTQTRQATRWLVGHVGEPLRRAAEGTPFSVELLCGIACQETAFLWLPWVERGVSATDIVARSIGDASGDAPQSTRSAFPRNTEAFRHAYGDEFTNMLIAEANASRALRGWGAKQWVYKGYGIFQFDLQHVRVDEAFFRQRQWYAMEACLQRVISQLTEKFRRTGELWAAVKAYNGAGARAEEYKENVRAFTAWARDEIGRMRAEPPVGLAQREGQGDPVGLARPASE